MVFSFKQTRRFSHPALLALIAVLPLIFVGSFAIFYNFSVTVDLVAKRSDTFTLFWPNSSGDYSQKRSTSFKYQKGSSVHSAGFSLYAPAQSLRIDPGNSTNTVIIKKITLSRLGSTLEIDGPQLLNLISGREDATVALNGSDLTVSCKKGDAKIFLKPLTQFSPPLGITGSFALFCIILYIGFTLLATRLLKSKNVAARWNWLVLSCLITGAGLFLKLPFLLLILIALFPCFTLLYILSALVNNPPESFSLHLQPLIICTAFFAFITIPMLFMIAPGSRFINTIPADIASVSKKQKDASWPKKLQLMRDKLEKTFTFTFPNRDKLIFLNSTIKIFGLGFSPTSKAIVGKDGMFFEGYGDRRVEDDQVDSFDNITDYMGLIPFSDEELKAWQICLEERYYWLKANGIDYVFALAPTKALIYPEKLPDSILKVKNRVNKPTRYEQLVQYLQEHSVVPVVNLKKALLQAKQTQDSESFLYYKTDFHWNYYGSFIAYQAIVKTINQAYPQYALTASSIDQFSIKKKTDWVHKNFMGVLGLNPNKHKNETYLTFQPKPESIYSHIDSFAKKGINDHSIPPHLPKIYRGHKLRLLENEQGKMSSLFIIGDSFSEKYFGYFSAHAKKTYNFRTVYSFHPEIYTDFKPDLIVQEVLNMYLLQKPPTNPKNIKQARVQALKELQ